MSLSARGDHDRDLGDAELPGGEYPRVARDQAAVLAHQLNFGRCGDNRGGVEYGD